MMKKILIVILLLITLVLIYALSDKSPAVESISANLRVWETNQKTFEFDKYKLSYYDSENETLEKGDRKQKGVILLLHGYPSSSYDWHLVWKGLSKDYRLIAMDMLGFGYSDKPNDIKYSISLQTDIQQALLLKLDINEVYLLAHDYGDNIAQELLARIDETDKLTVKSLVLLNGGLFPETYKPATIQSLLRSPIGPIVSKLGNSAVFEKSFSKVFGPNSKPSSIELTDHWYLICYNNGHKINHLLTHAADDRVRNRERWLNSLVTEDVPILFINGLDDPTSGKETVARYEELIPNPLVIKLPGVGHYPQLEVPQIVVEEFRKFNQ